MCLRVCAPLVRQKKKSEAVGMEWRTVLQFRDGGSGNSAGDIQVEHRFFCMPSSGLMMGKSTADFGWV